MSTPLAPSVRAEAAAWLARLHADDRSAADERAFQSWIEETPDNARAFDAVTATWDITGALKGGFPGVSRRSGRSRRAMLAGIGTLTVIGATAGALRSAYAGVYETEVGAQEHIALEDGTLAFLDTDTRIRVHYASDVRAVRLDRGRVNFRVAPDLTRPFVVDAAGRSIVATQTTFDVRRDGDRVSVLLLRGTASFGDVAPTGNTPRHVLVAGQRLVANATSMHQDRPELTPLLAWQSGQAVFENQTLAEAAEEMNRYSTMKLEIADPRAAQLHLSGVYRVGDNAAFARSVASLLPVQVEIVDGAVRLVADPTRMSGS